MKNAFLLGAVALAAIAAPASAATYVFASGNFLPGTTAPSPLLAPDVLTISGGSNKFFNGVSFTNQSGTVSWTNGSLFLQNAAAIDNQSLWDASFDGGLYNNGGAASTFTNSGTFRKSAGAGNTTVNAIGFVNSGTIDAQTGTILFNGGDAIFNNGSVFTGAGTVSINNDAAFNGAQNSSNLRFTGGTFTGNTAVLNGQATYTAGRFSGGWTVSNGSTLTVTGGTNKFLVAATIANDGTIAWNDGTLYMQNGTQVTNNGTVRATASVGLYDNGGTASTFTNAATGLVQVDAGATLTVDDGFVNNGGTLTANGTIRFTNGTAVFNAGGTFNGGGTVEIASSAAFNGAQYSSNLRFTGGTFTGNTAVLNDQATYTAGSFSGGWTVSNGSTLTVTGGTNKFLNAATMVNDGTILWNDATLYMVNGTQVTNNGTVRATASVGLYDNGGVASTFTNAATGLIEVDTGAVLTVNDGFVNDGGTLTANGAIRFINGTAVFNAGGTFNGGGTVEIASSAAFNGAQNSGNLRFTGGTFTGNTAVLNGQATFTAGNFSGGWTVSNGSTLTVTGGTNKFLVAATVANNGTIAWDNGSLFMQNGAQLTNTGTMTVTGNDGVYYNGGTATQFVNNGLIEKTGGTGVTTFASDIGFVNNGTINALSGTIALPSAFTNNGTLGGTTTFSTTTLTNAGTIAPGAPGTTGALQLTGSFVQAATGALATQLASSAAWDVFNISGSATLGGTLALSCIAGCNISTGDSFVILDSAGPLSGVFANITTTGFLNGFAYDVIYDYDNDLVRLSVLNAGMPNNGVPEPANWALMIAGFALAGGAARRRKPNAVLA